MAYEEYTPVKNGSLLVVAYVCDAEGEILQLEDYEEKGEVLKIVTEEFDYATDGNNLPNGENNNLQSPKTLNIPGVDTDDGEGGTYKNFFNSIGKMTLETITGHTLEPFDTDEHGQLPLDVSFPQSINPGKSKVIEIGYYGVQNIIVTGTPPDEVTTYEPVPGTYYEVMRVQHNYGGAYNHVFTEEETSEYDRIGKVRLAKGYVTYADGKNPFVYSRVVSGEGLSKAITDILENTHLDKYPNIKSIHIDAHSDVTIENFPLTSYTLSNENFRLILSKYEKVKFTNPLLTLPIPSGDVILKELIIENSTINFQSGVKFQVEELEISSSTFKTQVGHEDSSLTIECRTKTDLLFNILASPLHLLLINPDPSTMPEIGITGLTFDFTYDKLSDSWLKFLNVNKISVIDIVKNQSITNSSLIEVISAEEIAITDFTDKTGTSNRADFKVNKVKKVKLNSITIEAPKGGQSSLVTIDKSRSASELMISDSNIQKSVLFKGFNSTFEKINIIDSNIDVDTFYKGLEILFTKMTINGSKMKFKGDYNIDLQSFILDDSTLEVDGSMVISYKKKTNVVNSTFDLTSDLTFTSIVEKTSFNADGALLGGTNVLIVTDIIDSESKIRIDMKNTRIVGDESVTIKGFSLSDIKLGRFESKTVNFENIFKLKPFSSEILSDKTQNINFKESYLVKASYLLTDKGGKPSFNLINSTGNLLVEEDIKGSQGDFTINLKDSQILTEIRNRGESLSKVMVISNNSLSSAIGYGEDYNISVAIDTTCEDFKKAKKIDPATFKRNKVAKGGDDTLYYGIIEDVNDPAKAAE